MSRFGRYEVVEELYRTALATVSRARGTAIGDAKFVVKAFTPPAFGVVDASAEASFLEQAGVQQRVAAAKGSRHWATVHDLGKEGDAAFFVSDYYPLTAQRLITGRVSMTPASLHRLVSAVVRGLRELKAAADRTHGNLKPSNVLIAGQGDAAGAAGVVLADPAPAARLNSWGEQSDDFVALGHLIHQLVLHRPFRSPGGWPMEPSAEWSRLGRFGDRWRELCNRLLDPTAQQRPADLAELSRLVTRLGSNRKRRLKQLTAICLIFGSAAAGAGFVGYQLDAKHRAAVIAANDGWLGELQRRARQQAQSLDAFRSDPTLAGLLDAEGAARTRGVRFDLPKELPRDKTALDAYRQASDADAAVSDLRTRLAPDQWPLLKEAAGRAEVFRARGWSQPASELARVVDALSGGPRDSAYWKSVDDLLTLKPHAVATNTPAEQAWTKLERSIAAVTTKQGDAARVRDAMAAQAKGAARLTPAGLEGAEAFNACAAAMDAWIVLDRAGFDAAALSRELSAAKLEINANADPAALAAFAVRVGPVVRIAKIDSMPDLSEALRSFEQTKTFADADKKPDAERAAYEAAKADVAVQLAKLTQSGGTSAEAQSLRVAIEAFGKRWSSPSDPTAWLRTARAAPPVSSEALKGAWSRWLAAVQLTGDKMRDADVTPEVRAQADELRAALAELEKAFSPASAEMATLPPAFATAARERRELEMAALAAQLPRPGSPLPTALEDGNAGKAYAQWLVNLAALAKDFPVKEPMLEDPLPRPDEAWAKRDAAFWKDSVVQQLVRRDVKRLRELNVVRAETDRATLADYVTGGGASPEVAFAAWRRLGTIEGAKWPATPAELDAETRARTSLAEAIASFPQAEREAVTSELAAQGRARWSRFVNGLGADATDGLERAVAVAPSFGIPVEVVAGAASADAPLSPRARFNLLLRAARANSKGATDATAPAVAASLIAALPVEVKARVAPLVANLSKLDRKPWFPVAAKPAGEGRMTLAVANAPREVEFIRVQSPGVGSFYLSTTEVSLALFRAAAGDQLKALLPDPPPAGPSVWSWNGATLQEGAGSFGYWIPNDAAQNTLGFAEPLRQGKFNRFVLSDAAGGAPTADHPMQKVSPVAALTIAGALQCRLPSSAEWQAALSTVKDAKDSNLRDATWATQKAEVASAGGRLTGPWPDDGAFVPPGATIARRGAAKASASNDGTLYFRPAVAEAGKSFAHMVGNVAEFTFDAPESFEELTDKGPAAVAAFLKSRAAGVAVIGGSALSAPEIPTDKPQPVADVTAAYADVGFRLAFSEPAGSPLARLRAVLAGQPYLDANPK